MRALASCRWKMSSDAADADASNQVHGWRELVQELQARYPQRTEVVTLAPPVPPSCTTGRKAGSPPCARLTRTAPVQLLSLGYGICSDNALYV